MNNYKEILGEDVTVIREKDDSFWFSDKMEDWIGLHPKISRKVYPKELLEKQLNKRKRNKEPIKKERFYNSIEAGKYCGISNKRFQKLFKEAEMTFASEGKKRYSLDQLKKIKELVNYKESNKVLMIDQSYDAEKIANLLGLSIDQVKPEMNKSVYNYDGFKKVRNRLKQKYNLK